MFFFSATLALSVCFNIFLPGQVQAVSLLNLTSSFGNPLGATFASNSGYFPSSQYLFVSRVIGDAANPGEILTLQPSSSGSCKLKPITSVYIAPEPIGLSLDGLFALSNDRLYWETNHAANSAAQLYQWDAASQRAINVSFSLAPGSLWCVGRRA